MTKPLFALLIFSASAPAIAADPLPRIEITPFAGYRLGGEFQEQMSDVVFDFNEAGAFGLVVSGRVESNSHWEAFYSQQSTDVDVDPMLFGSGDFDLDVQYFHLGGSVSYDAPFGQPFVAATIGATRLDPTQAGFDAESFFSFSLGGGLRFAPTERIGVRLDARAVGTLVESDTDLFCLSDEGGATCALRVDGNVLWQFEGSAGISFRF